MDNITVVSGYWPVKNKHTHNKYNDWFKNSLQINQRYIFLCDQFNNDYIKQFRQNYETIFIDHNINNFHSKQYYCDHWIHPVHVPSKEVGMIWHEKMHCIKIAKDNDINPTEFYVWVDAGICTYRDMKPPSVRLNLKDINSLPHDKLCYSYVKEDYHNFAATVLIMHNSIIDRMHDIYYEYLEKVGNMYNDYRCGSDQVIHTVLMEEHPELYHKISDGYGTNLAKLYDL
jgi:hypothetical protein